MRGLVICVLAYIAPSLHHIFRLLYHFIMHIQDVSI